jgi:hypothetical protein
MGAVSNTWPRSPPSPLVDNLNRNVLAEERAWRGWQEVRAEQQAEAWTNTLPIPVVFPVGD